MESNPPPAIFNIDFDFNIPKEQCGTFQNIFSYIRKKFQVKYSRKSQIDSLLKKCKGKFFKAIHELMNLCLNYSVKRLPQNFITNITIEYNQKFLQKSVVEIYNNFNLLPTLNDIRKLKIIKTDKTHFFNQISEKNLSELYRTYMESERFKKDIEDVKKHDGKRNGILYEFVAKNFVTYYLYSKPHIIKSKDDVDDAGDNNINIGDNNSNINISTNNNNITNIIEEGLKMTSENEESYKNNK